MCCSVGIAYPYVLPAVFTITSCHRLIDALNFTYGRIAIYIRNITVIKIK
uniref:Uncharacterized protein n=1 Tax=Anguilla anguilla TaxID=7936 RepID=A0A0E9R9T9_ANGAN